MWRIRRLLRKTRKALRKKRREFTRRQKQKLEKRNQVHPNFPDNHTLREIGELIANRNPLWVEVGSGDRSGSDGWITVDVLPRCDIRWDLRRGLPFPNESVDRIYSSHFLEHLTYREGQQFIEESFRVLKKGGEFSACVPNARIYIEAYMNPDKAMEEFFQYRDAYNDTTAIDRLNYMAYMDSHHKYMFDLENLLAVIRKGGFSFVEERAFDPSIDMKERDYESIYARAVK
ncbi:MAG: methyltransferase domain-containing protein [Verrucomicrobiota bacterium]